MALIGPFDYAGFAASAQGDGRGDADELNAGCVDDSKGQTVDCEGADDRLAIEGHVGADEGRGLAGQPRGQSQRPCVGSFDFGAFGPFAQNGGRRSFRRAF